MQSIEAIRAKHEKELAQAIKENAIAQALPIEPKRVHAFDPHSWALYEAEGLMAALDIFKTYASAARIVNIEHRKGSFTTLVPHCAKNDKAEHKGDYCATLDTSMINANERAQISARLSFFAEVPNVGIIKVSAELGRKEYSTFNTYSQWAYAPQIIRNGNSERSNVKEFLFNNILYAHSDNRVAYSAGSTDSAHHVYLFVADDGEECKEHSNFIANLETIAHAFKEVKE